MTEATLPVELMEEPKTEAEMEAALAAIIAEIDRVLEHIHRDQADIDAIKAETAELRRQSEHLREEGALLDREIEVRLRGLQATVLKCYGPLSTSQSKLYPSRGTYSSASPTSRTFGTSFESCGAI